MKKYLLLFCCFVSFTCFAQPLFNKLYQPLDSTKYYSSYALFASNDTLYSLSAYSDTFPYFGGLIFNKFDLEGNLLLSKTLRKEYASFYLNNTSQLIMSPNKDKLFVFTTYSDTTYPFHYGIPNSWGDEFYEYDAILIAFDLNGDTIFTKKYDYGIIDFGQLVMPYRDKLVLAMESNNDTIEGNTNDYTRVIMVDSLGTEEWTHLYYHGNMSIPYSIVQTADSAICIGVYYRTIYNKNTESNRYFKIDSLGNVIWAKTVATNCAEYNPEMATTSYGDLILASEKCVDYDNWGGTERYRLRLRKISNTNGNQLWEKLYGDTIVEDFYINVYDVKVLTNDDILVAGTTYSPEYIMHYYTTVNGDTTGSIKYRKSRGFLLKTDSDGNMKFMRHYVTVDTADYHYFTSIEVLPDGGYILFGHAYEDGYDYVNQTFTDGDFDKPWIVKTDENGCIDLSCINSTVEISDEDYRLFVYPNPADNVLNIDLPFYCNSALINFYNLSGQLISKKQIYSSKYQALDISDIPDGMFVIEVIAKDKLLGRSKLVVGR